MAKPKGAADRSIPEQIRLRLEYLREQGLDYAFDRPSLHAHPPNASPPAKAEGAEGMTLLPATLSDIREEIGECTRCRLSEKRTQVVFGVGDPNARLMFVGEGPGEEEDLQGIPFVGRAGKLLTDIITRGMGLKREEVYIANVVKCRPPGNRTPLDDEIETCFPFLRAQILSVAPEVLVTLGAPASKTLLGVQTPISKLRGRWDAFEGIPVMPTFHPSYLLRNPSAKREVWEDIQLVMVKLGVAPPPKG